jgi:hypothetical protein
MQTLGNSLGNADDRRAARTIATGDGGEDDVDESAPPSSMEMIKKAAKKFFHFEGPWLQSPSDAFELKGVYDPTKRFQNDVSLALAQKEALKSLIPLPLWQKDFADLEHGLSSIVSQIYSIISACQLMVEMLMFQFTKELRQQRHNYRSRLRGENHDLFGVGKAEFSNANIRGDSFRKLIGYQETKKKYSDTRCAILYDNETIPTAGMNWKKAFRNRKILAVRFL